VSTLLAGIPDGQSVVEVGQVIAGEAGVDLQ
jgi:hypothetical protein